jgi:hypothetical protein
VDNPGDDADAMLILLGDGNGGCGAPVAHPAPGHPVNLILADLDLDSHADLLAACYEAGGLWPYLGNGAGGFTPLEFVPVGQGVRGLAALDLEGDGDLDAAVAARSEDRLYLLGNTTDPTTPVLIESFSITLAGQGVRIRWRTEAALTVASFCCSRVEAMGATALPITEEAEGTFTAFDPTPQPLTDDRAEYILEVKDGTGWQLLRRESIVLSGSAGQLPALSCQPNPFGPATAITYHLRAAERCRLEIIDAAGHRVRSLIDHGEGQGELQAIWDGRDDTGRQVAAGVYFAHFAGAGRSEVVKLILLR